MIKWGAISFFIRILAACLAILFTMLLTRLLGEVEFGRFSLLSSLYALLLLAVQLGFPAVVTRSYYQEGGQALAGVAIRTANHWMAATSVLACFVAFAINIIFSADAAAFTALLPVLLFMTARNNVGSGRLRALDSKLLSMVLEQLTRYLIPIPVILAGGYLLNFQWTAFSVLSVIAVGYAVSAVLAWAAGDTIDGSRHQTGYWLPRKTLEPARIPVRPIVMSAIRISLIQMLGVVNRNIDLILISYLLGLIATGEYRVAVVLSSAVLFSVPAVTNIVATRILKEHSENKIHLQRTMTKAAWLVFSTSVAANLLLMLSGRFFVETMFGTSYEGAIGPLFALCFFQGVTALFGIGGYLLNMTGHEKVVFRNSLLAVVFNIIGNISLIPHLGILGASISTGAMGIFVAALNWHAARHIMGIDCSVFRRLHC